MTPEKIAEVEKRSGLPIETLAAAAAVAHEANAEWSRQNGDRSHQRWPYASKRIRESAILGVTQIAENPELTPEESHELWAAHKQSQGWVYGEKKDEAERTHPCLIPYDELPEAERLKDRLFGATVRAVLGLVTFEVEPVLDTPETEKGIDE